MDDNIDAYAITLDSEIIDQDIDKIDLFGERIVEEDNESEVDFDY
jgi:hypothetical protein